MKLRSKVKRFILQHRMLSPGDTVICAVSGGADSLCLLHLLANAAVSYKKETEEQVMTSVHVRAVHVHHGIRGASADADAARVQNICKDWGVPLTVRYADAPALAQKEHIGLEEAARKLRYQVLFEEVQKNPRTVIAVAHNLDDNAETLLMHLCRGAGIQGLAGIAPVKNLPYEAFGTALTEPDDVLAYSSEKERSVQTSGESKRNRLTHMRIIRPLLKTTRAEIEEYLCAQGITWCTDETNADTAYTRNAVRNELFPYLAAQINARSKEHIAEAAEHLREVAAYLDRQAECAYERCLTADGALNLQQLKTEDDLIQSEILKMAITRHEETVNRTEIQAIAETKTGNKSEPKTMTDTKNNRRARSGASESYERNHLENLKKLVSSLDGTKTLNLPGGITAERRYDKLYFHSRSYKKIAPQCERVPESAGSLCETNDEAQDFKAALALPTKAHPCRQISLETGIGLELRFFETMQENSTVDVGDKNDGSSNGYITPLIRESKDAFRASYTNRLDYDKMNEVLCSEKEEPTFRKRAAKDHLLIAGGRHKTLKKYMIDDKIPACARDGMYVLAAGSRVLWIPGFYTEPGLMAGRDSERVLELIYTK